jgi:hypothetical protein
LALIAHFLGAPKFLENQATSFTFLGADLVISTLWAFHFTLLPDHAFILPALSANKKTHLRKREGGRSMADCDHVTVSIAPRSDVAALSDR